jgi:hypothetical protein
MTQQLRAQSISIQVSNRTKCIGSCKGCIAASTQNAPLSHMNPEKVQHCDLRHVRKGLRFAERCGATHAILTSKADPLQEDAGYLKALIELCAEYMPVVDMHTNGWLFRGHHPKQSLVDFECAGLSMLTLSVSHDDPILNRTFMGGPGGRVDSILEDARRNGLLTRVSLLMHREGVQDLDDILRYIKHFGDLGVHMVVVRELWTPRGLRTEEVAEALWSVENKVRIAPMQAQFADLAEDGGEPDYGLRVSNREPLPWGQPVYAVSGFDDLDYGMNVTFARCDEGQKGLLIKSIVHKPDGHGYRDILY